MQLTGPHPGDLRARLGAAACVLLAAGLPAAAGAQTAEPGWRLDGAALLYGEQNRTNVVEPMARITRIFADGQSLAAQFGFDVITGASPNGALPTGKVQTTTTASGQVRTIPAGQIPTTAFHDLRGSLDLEWKRPIGTLLTATTGGHVSREKDYQSLGASGSLALETMHRLTTFTLGGSVDHDGVFPTGGTPDGLTDGTLSRGGTDRKDVTSAAFGVSRILTRRWMVGVNVTRTSERGYLTEPYKVVSVLDPADGSPVSQLTERRPDTRARTSVAGSSVYHLDRDVLYLSYRRYRDDWGVASHMVDARYRRELGEGSFLQPHLRLYTQRRADFFTFGLLQGAPLPAFASSDYRLGALRTATLGATYGFRVPGYPGDWTARAEYMLQWGDGHPADAVGVQRNFDLMPPVSIGSLLVGYTLRF